MEEMKNCIICQQNLDVIYFRKKYKSNERKNICKFCLKKLEKEGYIYCRKCEEIKPATTEYFGKRKCSKKLETICRECERKNVSKWQKENKEKAAKKVSRYQKTEKGIKTRELKRIKYKKKLKSLPNTLTIEQWELIKMNFNNTCAYCGQAKKLEHDHVVPVSNDGELTHNNIVPSCRSCNASKGNYDFKTWYRKQSFYSPAREKAILKFLGYKEDKQQLKLI